MEARLYVLALVGLTAATLCVLRSLCCSGGAESLAARDLDGGASGGTRRTGWESLPPPHSPRKEAQGGEGTDCLMQTPCCTRRPDHGSALLRAEEGHFVGMGGKLGAQHHAGELPPPDCWQSLKCCCALLGALAIIVGMGIWLFNWHGWDASGSRPVVSMVQYNCDAPGAHWQYEWPQEKQRFCCERFGRGCPGALSPSPAPPKGSAVSEVNASEAKAVPSHCAVHCSYGGRWASCARHVQDVIAFNDSTPERDACAQALARIQRACPECGRCNRTGAHCPAR